MSHYLGPLPAPLQEVGTRLVDVGYFAELPEQVIINEYLPGQGIAAHIDCVPCFGSAIASLTLGSGCTMDFTHPTTLEKVSLYLEPRSLVVLTGTARYDWRHGIAGRRSDRVEGVVRARGHGSRLPSAPLSYSPESELPQDFTRDVTRDYSSSGYNLAGITEQPRVIAVKVPSLSYTAFMAEGDEDREFLTVEQAASYLQLSTSSIRSYIREGKLKAFRVAGLRKVLIQRSDLLALLEPARPTES